MNKLDIKHRDPNEIMKLSRLGSFHQSKLSFLRSFIREFKNWDYKNNLFELDLNGNGSAIYSFSRKDRVYSLVCFSQYIDPDERSDRVIANKWDAAFVLYDGIPSTKDINRLRKNVPKQELGRVSCSELALSRANKSVRVFDHVVEALSQGTQPDTKLLNKVGYLYRTTAVYGSGKFGLADRFRIKDRKEIYGPFRLEMMLVYLVRQFTFDQVNHIAKSKNPKKAVELDLDIARNLGIGNSTGLGMAPFIINHPTLLHNWIYCRETALKEIRSIEKVDQEAFNHFKYCLDKSKAMMESWQTSSQFQNHKINLLKQGLVQFDQFLEKEFSIKDKYPWNNIYIWASNNLQDEALEYIVSMMMEPYDDIINPLINNMSSDEEKYFTIPGHKKISDLRSILEKNYKSFLEIDFNEKINNTNFWFISKNKAEPRIANRYEDFGGDLEQPLAIARDIKQLYEKIILEEQTASISNFLSKNDEFRHVIRRAFIVEKCPYSEIQDNTIGDSLVPIDMLRLKLSFFGAVKFDPRSDKWLRINMYQGAPLSHEMKTSHDTWIYNVAS